MGTMYFVLAGMSAITAIFFVYLVWKEWGPGSDEYEEVPAVQCWWCGEVVPYYSTTVRSGLRVCKKCNSKGR
jgi:hypothetical protein